MESAKSKFTFISFILSEAPKFTLEPKVPSGNLTAGFPVTMTWNVSGIPKPEMRWKSPSEGYVTLVNPRFLLSERNLTIKTLEEKDAGIWTIEATNSLKTTKVQVEFGTIFGKRLTTILDPALFSLNTRIPFDQRILWYILSKEVISLSFFH